MSSSHVYKVVAPDGTVFSRKTERTYTHLVIGRLHEKFLNITNWRYLGWCSRLDLAEKLASREAKHWHEVKVIEVPQPQEASA